jgi:Ca2+-binding RTX toxin-like protein
VEEQGGEGTDLVLSSVDFDLGAGTPETSFVERLTLTGTASINAFGNGLDNRLTGNDGNNVLDGRGGRDIMTGGRGNDIYYVDTAGDRVIEDNAPGIDRVFSSVSFNLTGQFVEHLTLVGSGAMNGVGNQLNNRIVGGAGNNILNGGLGTDTMTGGAGGDRFVFNTALTPANVDTITDFNVDHDTIGLDDAIFSALSGVGVLDTAEFAWTLDGEAADATDRIVYDASSGNLFYDADGSGAGGKLLFATIAPHLAGLTNADFVVV